MLKAGFTSEDDVLPHKMMETPIEKGPHAGRVFKKADFEKGKKLYYKTRGWDEMGVPTREKLAELGLDRL
jgi:aldehyde:ferredoxin oxidoreductase